MNPPQNRCGRLSATAAANFADEASIMEDLMNFVGAQLDQE